MKKAIKMIAIVLLSLLAVLAIVWFTNLGGIKGNIYVGQIVKMRVAPKRLSNPKNPSDYGMAYKSVDIVTDDKVRLSAWEIPAPSKSNKTIIINHPLTCTRYGSLEGLDGVPVQFLPMVKHLHDNGYNIVMYDHRGQGESDGGYGKTAQGCEAPVGAGVTEWQDVVGALNYVKNHADFKDDSLALLSQCMGANATFLAWHKAPNLFNQANIKCMVAIQPTISYNMISRFIKLKTKMDLVDAVEAAQKKQFGFGFAQPLEDIKSLTVPILFTQVRKDQYTYDAATGKNDIELIYAACPTEKELIWIGTKEAKPFGSDKRFEGYAYFNEHPEELLAFLHKKLN